MNRPCSTGNDTFSFDLATKLSTHFGSKDRSGRRSTTKCRLASDEIGATGIFGDSISLTGSSSGSTKLQRERDQRSDEAALLFREEFEELTFQMKEGRKTSAYFFTTFMKEISQKAIDRPVAEKIEQRSSHSSNIRRREEFKRGVRGQIYPCRSGNDGLSKPRPGLYCWARYWCAEPSALLLRSHALESDFTLDIKEMDKLEFEQWPQVTRCKNRKTLFRREAITGSTHPRQATDWLAEIDQAQWMSFATLDSQNANGPMNIEKFRWRKNLKKSKISR